MIAEGKLFVIKNNGAVYAITKRNGKVRWRRDLGKLAASAPAYADGRIYVTILAARRLEERAASPRCGPRTARACGRSRCRAAPSPRRCSPAGASTSAPRTGRSTRCAPATAASSGATRRPGRSRAALALADGKLYFGDYGGRVHAIRESSGKRVWSVGTHGARFGTSSGQFYATPAARLRPRLHRQHRLQRLLVLGVQRQARVARRARAATSTPPPRSRRCRAASRRSTSAPTTRASTRSTPRAARCAGSTRRRAGSRAPRPSSATSSTSATSSRAPRPGSARARPQGLPLRPRRLQPGRLRRPQPLPGRLRVALAAQAAGRRRDADRHAAAARWLLELGHRVLPVVEDRGEQDGVGARLEGVDEVARARPAPPEAMTGTSTAPEIARSRSVS